MKDFGKFLEEVTIRGNPAVPSEAERNRDDKRYLSDIERRAKDRLGITGREDPRRIGGRMMELVEMSQRATRGHEDELEELAKTIILAHFGDILDGVELDIQLVRGGAQVANFMDEEEGEPDDAPPPRFRDIRDPDMIKKIHKAKIANNIIQGEAKNTKHILQLEEVKDGIETIFGRARGENIFNMWNEITNLADKMDWIIPIDIKANMMEQQPEGMAGAVKVDWKAPGEWKPKEDEEFNPDEEQKEEPEEDVYHPVIRARGVDFPMLLHETVKGIFELIAAVSQPGEFAPEEEIQKAKTVQLNVSSFADEAEDFQTGPEIAADLRDFINRNPAAQGSMRAFIFGKMMDPNYMTDDEFLRLFRGILNETPEARAKIDAMIGEVNDQLKNYALGEAGVDVEEPVEEEPEEVVPEAPKAKMSVKEIQELIDKALDDGNFDEVRRLSQYLKEGKEIYLREIERINEAHKFHTRRK